MREIKIRAWGPNQRHMWQWEELKKSIALDWLFSDSGEKKLMQFTGIRDENEKEIFEGDIVKINNPLNQIQKACLIGVVSVSYCSFCVEVKKILQWENYSKNILPPDNLLWFLNIVDAKIIEIIGNIYENPELLEGNND